MSIFILAVVPTQRATHPSDALGFPRLGVSIRHPVEKGHEREIRQRVSPVIDGVFRQGGQTFRELGHGRVHVGPQQGHLPERLERRA